MDQQDRQTGEYSDGEGRGRQADQSSTGRQVSDLTGRGEGARWTRAGQPGG